MNEKKPINPKVLGAPAGAGTGALIAWLASLAGVEMPEEVVVALVGVLGALASWLIPGKA